MSAGEGIAVIGSVAFDTLEKSFFKRYGSDNPHAACVRPFITVAKAFVIARRRHRNEPLAIGQYQMTQFFARRKFLKQRTLSGFPKTAF